MRPARFLGLLAIGLAVAPPTLGRQAGEFYHIQGSQVVDADGNPAMIRGMGLGGWLMPEGYMLKMGGSWTSMRQKVEQVVDASVASRVWARYRENYVAEKDIAALSAWGFDHVRLPFHYEVFYSIYTDSFNEEGFTLLDEFLGWCETHELAVILDLHAAPGGQSDGAIADANGEARLWTQPDPYQGLTIKIWEEIARRYKDDTRILGYDLLNEPVTPNSVPDGAQALRDFYGRLVDAIRLIDTNHIVFIEGNYFATTFDRLTPPFDDKMVYAFHKYWSAPSIGTIQYIINIRTDHGTPLWLGETGENSNPWLHEVTRLAETNGIGWNFWTHKQLSSTVPPTSATLKPGFQRLLDYWNGSASKPSPQFAEAALFEMVDGLAFDSVRVNQDVLEALFNPTFGTDRRPYKDHVIPGTIEAVHYDVGTQGVAYSDKDYWAVTGSPGGGNNGGQFRNDGVDIEISLDPQGFGYNVGWIEPFEWMEYTVRVDSAATYDVEVRLASQTGGGELLLLVDGSTVGRLRNIAATGGWQSWRSEWIRGVRLDAGTHVLRVAAGRTGNFNLNRMVFQPVASTQRESSEWPGRLGAEAYPQPAAGSVSIRLDSGLPHPIQVQFFDLLGRRMGSKTVQPGIMEEDISRWAPGVYFYQVSQGTTRLTGRLVVGRD